jgi:hypothetical protein
VPAAEKMMAWIHRHWRGWRVLIQNAEADSASPQGQNAGDPASLPIGPINNQKQLKLVQKVALF